MTEATTTRKKTLRSRQARPSFDVTQTIGTVMLDGEGENTPHEAAFLLIARHGSDGTFHFPAETGGMVAVTVENILDAPVPEPPNRDWA